MQRKVLDSLYKLGGLTLFAFPGETDIPLESLHKMALALNAGASFVLLDFSQKTWDSELTQKRKLPESDEEFRQLYHDLEELKKKTPHIVGILPPEISEQSAHFMRLVARALVLAPSGDPQVDTAAAYLEDAPSLQAIPLLWLYGVKPERKRFPHAYRAIRRSPSFLREVRKANWQQSPESFVRIIEDLHKIEILKKNPLDGSVKAFCKFYPILILAILALPFFFVSKLEPAVSNTRDRSQECSRFSLAPSFEYQFDGIESMQRISRYAIGRFNATITNERMIRQYVNVTLEENGYEQGSWEKDNKNIPPSGTILKFSRPDYLESAASDSIGAAWKYWTSIMSDSISYITEFYHATASRDQRQHNGIDLASRQGSRILAPFAAKAWTSKDDRGGVIIGLVREKDVILFMHCDKLLYLDGQEVMAGDPIATVGVTGHTTGPHAHIVTGIISKNGDKHIGNVRYNVIDPIKWFYKFKPTSP